MVQLKVINSSLEICSKDCGTDLMIGIVGTVIIQMGLLNYQKMHGTGLLVQPQFQFHDHVQPLLLPALYLYLT